MSNASLGGQSAEDVDLLIMTAISCNDLEKRITAISCLSDLREPSIVQVLISLLEDERLEIVESSTQALVKMGQISIKPMIESLPDVLSRAKICIACALGTIKDIGAADALISLLEDESVSVKCSAIYALGEMKAETSFYKILELAESDNEEILEQVAFALGRIGFHEALETLFEIVRHENRRVRQAANSALIDMVFNYGKGKSKKLSQFGTYGDSLSID